MPSVKLFGRRWLVASDDLVFPGIFELTFRFIWLVLIILVCVHYYPYTWECEQGGVFVRAYLLGLISLLGVVILLLVLLVNRSAQGSIMDVEARKHVPLLLTIKILMIIPEVSWNIMGTVWAFTNMVQCRSSENFTASVTEGLVLFNWVQFALTVFGLALVFDPLGSLHLEGDDDIEKIHHRKVTNLWMRRFRWIFCWLRRDEHAHEAFQHIANVNEVLRDAPKWMSVETALHYLKLSIAAYGWPFVMYRYPVTGLFRLCSKMKCCGCCRRKAILVKGDNCCLCHLSGTKYLSQLSEGEILYASYHNDLFQLPYFVAADHKTRSIVLVIRGSISLRDVFTDLTAGAEFFDAPGIPANSMAHQGMIAGANYIKKDLEEVEIIEKALSSYPNYNLTLTGHSLGAGVAVLLALLLRPKYPDIKVYAISPPAGLLSREASRVTEDFTFSLGIGDDFVMRLGVESMENIRTNALRVLKFCKLPKYRIMLNGFGYALFGIPAQDLESIWKDDVPPLATPGQLPLLLNSSRTSPSDESLLFEKDVTRRRFCSTHLYTPGRILHITRRKKTKAERKAGTGGPSYEMRWAVAEEFTEFRVMPRMLLDHLPENVYDALETMLQEQQTIQREHLPISII
ncbi:diacylglycerol lipase-beta isoform X2 [Anabrus simplex]|uniref:diacylglycerol lipase-beta isoform X2 n=1 Tax=Anabrus simplex TaxID=316456 RepID=UPI0035A28330